MQLLIAILKSLLHAALVIAGLMAVLFAGYLVVSEFGPTVRDGFGTSERLEELDDAGREHARSSAVQQAESVTHVARHNSLQIRLSNERDTWRQQLDEELESIRETAENRAGAIQERVALQSDFFGESAEELESRYCDSFNPANWWACYKVRQRLDAIDERMSEQRESVEQSARELREEADRQAEQHRQDAERRLEERTAEFDDRIERSRAELDDLEDRQRELDERIEQIRTEQASLRSQNWIWIEFRKRWPYLLAVALLIFTAPYLRRTLWYFVGMPLVSSADPIELSPRRPSDESDGEPRIICGESRRTLDVEIPPDRRLLARTGYIQSDREGAKSELFFDQKSPNLSYISGLVLLTRLDSGDSADGPRPVSLGTPDDPDAYLMRVDLENHPGVVFRARHVVAVIGDIDMNSDWRIGSLHAWATTQIRFISFSGTGTLIVEGWGDVRGHHLEDQREQKRMTKVIGFDTRLRYWTQRSATFLPYFLDPDTDPLVVDVFEGTGTVFFEKNPSLRKQHRSTGEKIAGFFLEAFKKLLGL